MAMGPLTPGKAPAIMPAMTPSSTNSRLASCKASESPARIISSIVLIL